MGRWCPWRNGRRNCWGPIADFIIQTQNLLHHFIGHRESNYSVVQFSTQWLYWGSKLVFYDGERNVLLFCLLFKNNNKSLHFQYKAGFACVPFFFVEMELIIFIFLLLNNQAIFLVVCWLIFFPFSPH